MNANLLLELEAFMTEFDLSAHRVGLLAVGNGRLVERLRGGGRVWPETEAAVKDFLVRERQRRVADFELKPADAPPHRGGLA